MFTSKGHVAFIPSHVICESDPMTSLTLPQVKTIKLPQGLAGIIGVHDGVDDVVHDDEPPRAGSVLGPAEEGIHEHGHVVVPMEIRTHTIAVKGVAADQ